jgi:dienelactone hydrolase
MADYQPDFKALGYASGTMKAIWDNIRGLDLLDSLPYVKAGHHGAIGHSLGGHNAIYTAVFDARIKVVVSSCGFDSFLHYMDGDVAGWTQELYMPRIATYELKEIPFDFHELMGALAPRTVYVSAPTGDANFKWESVDEIATAARKIFSLYGAADNLIIKHPDCEHDFPDEVREPAFDVILKTLK